MRRGDLADRTVFLHLPPITPDTRRGDEDFWIEFQRDYPLILGSLLDAVAGGIRFWPEVRLTELSRMADTDRWGEAVAAGLGWPAGTFAQAYKTNRWMQCKHSLEESPVYFAVVKLLIDQRQFDGSPAELFGVLDAFIKSRPSLVRGWPKTPMALSKALSKIALQLREIGISVEFSRDRDSRAITIRQIGTFGAPHQDRYPRPAI